MGYAKRLKNERAPIVKYIEDELDKIKNEDLPEEKLFDRYDNILKIVEIKFKVERNDSKLYNKYNKIILFDLLPKQIFQLSYLKPEDYELTIDKIDKTDLKFIYIYSLKHYIFIMSIYDVLYKNLIDTWISEDENGVEHLFYGEKEKNKSKEIIKKQKEHIANLNKLLKEYYNIDKLKNKEFYDNLFVLVKEGLDNVNKIKQENQRNFYRYHLENLYNDIKNMLDINTYNYIEIRINLINEYLK